MKVRSFLVGSTITFLHNGSVCKGTVLFKWKATTEQMIAVRTEDKSLFSLPARKCMLHSFKLDGKVYNALGEEIA